MKFLHVNKETCTGCRICELACSMERSGKFNPHISRIRILREEPGIDAAIFCRQCRKPPCAEACPVNAIQPSALGIIHVKEDLCIGCGFCVEACPFGAMNLDSVSKIALNCDLCGGNPKCIEWCPVEAITYRSEEIVAQEKRNHFASKAATLTDK